MNAIFKRIIKTISGSHNPCNYDGMPSIADNKLWFYNFSQQQWQVLTINTASMDHRGLLTLDGNALVIIGGIQNQQQVSANINIIATSILRP